MNYYIALYIYNTILNICDLKILNHLNLSI